MLTSKQVKNRKISLDKRLDKVLLEISQLQEDCQHENAKHTNRSDTGNYCKADDSFWIEHKCSNCDKFWTTGQNYDRLVV